MTRTSVVAGVTAAALAVPMGGAAATVGRPAPVSERPLHGAPSRLQQPVQPRLIAVRAHRHGTSDRIVFAFAGGTPRDVRAHYVHRLIADPSGRPVRIAGNAVLEVRFEPTGTMQTGAQTGARTAAVPRRTAFALPDVLTVVRSGAFEGVSSYGIGLVQRGRFEVHRRPAHHRVVVDVRAAFPTVQRRVWFFDRARFLANREPFFVPRSRPVRPATPAGDALLRLFAGPLAGERTQGLRLLRSGSTGASVASIRDRVARVRLAGGCRSGGSTVTVAGEIVPTLRQFAGVDWVKILDPAGHTADPTGHSDSIPDCLNP